MMKTMWKKMKIHQYKKYQLILLKKTNKKIFQTKINKKMRIIIKIKMN